MWDYIEGRVTDGPHRARAGGDREQPGAVRRRSGQAYGVDPYVLGAIWGIETDYGAVLDNGKLIRPIIRSLATLVHQRRGRLKEDEADFIAALLLVQRGPLAIRTPGRLVGRGDRAPAGQPVQRHRAWHRRRRRRARRPPQFARRCAGDEREIPARLSATGPASTGGSRSRCPTASTTCWPTARRCGRSRSSPSAA